MPEYVVILIYMKISGRCGHVSVITSVVGDFLCLTEQGCFSFSGIPLRLMHAQELIGKKRQIRKSQIKKTNKKKKKMFVSLICP